MATEAAERAGTTARAERQPQAQGAQADEEPGDGRGRQQERPEGPSPTLEHRAPPPPCSREERDRI
eukprot:13906328-Heterocapsa_arctica.AAC.1